MRILRLSRGDALPRAQRLKKVRKAKKKCRTQLTFCSVVPTTAFLTQIPWPCSAKRGFENENGRRQREQHLERFTRRSARATGTQAAPGNSVGNNPYNPIPTETIPLGSRASGSIARRVFHFGAPCTDPLPTPTHSQRRQLHEHNVRAQQSAVAGRSW